MKNMLLTFSLMICIFSHLNAQSDWFERSILNTIVLIQKYEDGKYVTHGTGFLLYNYQENNHKGILVTCAHILKRHEIFLVVSPDSNFKSMLIKGGYKSAIIDETEWELDGDILRTRVGLKKDSNYVIHNSLDIGALYLKLGTKVISVVNDSTVEQRIANISVLPRSMFKERKKSGLGTEVYFVGFPFGIGGQGGYFEQGMYSEKMPNPLLRSGIIAWISDSNNEFLLDAVSYGGNSGSPIFTKRTIFQAGPYLIGMVSGHLGSDFVNFGLAKCFWVDDILMVVDKLLKLR